MHKEYKKLSVLIPAWNEANRIEQTLVVTREFLETLPQSWEIVVVDDGSSDHTYQKAQALSDSRINVIQHPVNKGKGQALKTAFQHSTGDIVLFLDGDLDIHPDQCVPLLNALAHSDCQVAIGSKQHPQSNIRYPLKRRLMSFTYSQIVQFLFNLPVRDTQTGIKLFEHEVLKKVFHRVQLSGFAFDLELLALTIQNGFSIVEVPINMQFGEKRNNMSPKVILNMLRDTLFLFYRMHSNK